MTWLGWGVDLLLAGIGVWLLLRVYRILGKPLGADDKYDAAMARLGSQYKIVGWCCVLMGGISLIGGLLGIGF